MKNYLAIFLFVVSVPLVISSCKDDEDAVSPLVGTWEEVSFATTGCIDPDDNFALTCTSSCERIVVTENTITFGSDPAEPYTATGTTITVTETSGATTTTTTVNYTISGTTLTINFTDDPSDGGCTVTLVYRKV